jgi:hypothetical protein
MPLHKADSAGPVSGPIRDPAGSTVYAGGDFRSIGGRSRDRIAALDATTGRVMSWNPAANGTVQTIAVSGSTVYAGGGFTAIAGRSRRYVAALSARTGQTTAWNPGVARVPKEGSGVLTLAVAGSSLPRRRLHVGGRAHPRPYRRRAGGYWVCDGVGPACRQCGADPRRVGIDRLRRRRRSDNATQRCSRCSLLILSVDCVGPIVTSGGA